MYKLNKDFMVWEKGGIVKWDSGQLYSNSFSYDCSKVQFHTLLATGIIEEVRGEEWKPKHCEAFYYTDAGGRVQECNFQNDFFLHAEFVKVYNYFRTEALAKEAGEKVKELLKSCKHY